MAHYIKFQITLANVLALQTAFIPGTMVASRSRRPKAGGGRASSRRHNPQRRAGQDVSPKQPQRRSTRPRKEFSMAEDDTTETDSDDLLSIGSPPATSSRAAPASVRKSSRNTAHRPNYNTDTDTNMDDDFEDYDSEDASRNAHSNTRLNGPSTGESHPVVPKKRSARAAGAKDRRARNAVTSRNSSSKGKGKVGHVSRGSRDQLLAGPSKSTATFDWTGPAIPFEAWLIILENAAELPNQDGIDTQWLLQTATVCRTVADAALRVLYRCPQIETEGQLMHITSLVRRRRGPSPYNYRMRITSLHLNVESTLKSARAQTYLVELLQNLPNLSDLVIFHPKDKPPYRLLTDSIRWSYPEELFTALEPNTPDLSVAVSENDAIMVEENKTQPTYLRNWQWSSRMLGKGIPLARLQEIHLAPSFTTLRKISFVNFQLPSLNILKDIDNPDIIEADKECVRLIAGCISVLEKLEHLVFDSSTVMNASLLRQLPRHLIHLELINCWEVTSDDFGEFLVEGGAQIEYLTLNHNQSLNLSFLRVLGLGCPKLRQLRMNLTYFKHHESSISFDPMYDYLLLPSEVPNWPSSLELIELENLRGWDGEAAEMFLQSFIDNAHNLLNLRHLSVKAMLSIPWRQRSELRRKWQSELEHVFLRPFVPPRNNTTVVRRPTTPPASTPENQKAEKEIETPSRRSNRLAYQSVNPSSRGSSRERRSAGGGGPSYLEPDSDEFDSDAMDGITTKNNVSSNKGKEAMENTSQRERVFLQGLCTVVDFKFDNQKPTEHQYGMEDFLDNDRYESDNASEGNAEWNRRYG
jgi:hypothetical protein